MDSDAWSLLSLANIDVRLVRQFTRRYKPIPDLFIKCFCISLGTDLLVCSSLWMGVYRCCCRFKLVIYFKICDSVVSV